MIEDLARLRKLVDDATLEGRTRLPAEEQLSEKVGVSRARLRTLLKRLESEGLIWRHVGKGTFIGQRHLSVELDNWSADVSLDDVMHARILLEPQLAAEAAVHSTPADVAAMEACIAEMAASPNFAHWRRLDERLHRSVAQAAHNLPLLVLYDTLRTQVRVTLRARIDAVFGGACQPMDVSDAEHLNLVSAIAIHDPNAAELAMRVHLLSVRQRLFGIR